MTASASVAWALTLLVVAAGLFGFLGGGVPACPVCGARGREHDESCPWKAHER
jgi:hypothetical protein